MPNLQMEQAKRELWNRYSLQRDSFLEFVKMMYKEEKGYEFKISKWHTKVFGALELVKEGKILRLIVNIPPRAGKTDIFTILFPIWCMGHEPMHKNIVCGYSASLTEKFSGEARQLYNSKTFKKIFPYRSHILSDANTKELWVNRRNGHYKASGMEGTITGIGANLIVVDDPIKPEEVKSDARRESVNSWFDGTLMSRLEKPSRDPIVLVMQRLHSNDLTGYLLAKTDKEGNPIWRQIKIEALAEADSSWRKYGESYFPERFSEKDLQMIKDNDPITFESQYQQNPVSALTQEFFPEFFKHYDEIDLANARIFTVVDPAFSQKKGADFSCVMTGAFIDEKLYILEYVANRYNATDLIETIIYQVNKWKPEVVGVESVQAQVLLKQQLENEMRSRNIYRTIKEIKTRENKEKRIRDLERLIRYGQIVWKKTMTDLESQFIQFPHSKHDDIIDCITLLYQVHTPTSKATNTDFNFTVTYDKLGRPIVRM